MVPANASLVGEHTFSGQGVPEGFKFAIGAQQDLMPAVELRRSNTGGATQLEWAALPTARAYFIAAMGAKGGSEADLVTLEGFLRRENGGRCAGLFRCEHEP